jgi:hypothetical protein
MPTRLELQTENEILRAKEAAADLRVRKARAVAAALEQPTGVTAAELVEAHGFQTVSVKKQAELLGIAVRCEMDNGRRRYFRV